MNSKEAIETTSTTEDTLQLRTLEVLQNLVSRLDSIDERLEAIEVRLSDMDLDTGGGFEID